MGFISRGSVAAKVRRAKEAHPERYCANRVCLWRIVDRDGNPTPCPNHMAAPANRLEGLLRQSVEATAP